MSPFHYPVPMNVHQHTTAASCYIPAYRSSIPLPLYRVSTHHGCLLLHTSIQEQHSTTFVPDAVMYTPRLPPVAYQHAGAAFHYLCTGYQHTMAASCYIPAYRSSIPLPLYQVSTHHGCLLLHTSIQERHSTTFVPGINTPRLPPVTYQHTGAAFHYLCTGYQHTTAASCYIPVYRSSIPLPLYRVSTHHGCLLLHTSIQEQHSTTFVSGINTPWLPPVTYQHTGAAFHYLCTGYQHTTAASCYIPAYRSSIPLPLYRVSTHHGCLLLHTSIQEQHSTTFVPGINTARLPPVTYQHTGAAFHYLCTGYQHTTAASCYIPAYRSSIPLPLYRVSTHHGCLLLHTNIQEQYSTTFVPGINTPRLPPVTYQYTGAAFHYLCTGYQHTMAASCYIPAYRSSIPLPLYRVSTHHGCLLLHTNIQEQHSTTFVPGIYTPRLPPVTYQHTGAAFHYLCTGYQHTMAASCYIPAYRSSIPLPLYRVSTHHGCLLLHTSIQEQHSTTFVPGINTPWLPPVTYQHTGAAFHYFVSGINTPWLPPVTYQHTGAAFHYLCTGYQHTTAASCYIPAYRSSIPLPLYRVSTHHGCLLLHTSIQEQHSTTFVPGINTPRLPPVTYQHTGAAFHYLCTGYQHTMAASCYIPAYRSSIPLPLYRISTHHGCLLLHTNIQEQHSLPLYRISTHHGCLLLHTSIQEQEIEPCSLEAVAE